MDEDPIINEVSASDLMVSIEENPMQDQLIGTIQATTDSGSLSFSFDQQSHPGALSLANDTGELSVADPSFFDFEINQTITAVVNVSNGDNSAESNIIINIEDIPIVSGKLVNLISNPIVVINDPSDWNNSFYYSDGVISKWVYGYSSAYETYIFISANGRLTKIEYSTFDNGPVGFAEIDLFYDSSDNLIRIRQTGDLDYDYLIQANGSTISFQDQMGNNNKSIIVNQQGRMLSYLDDSYYFTFTYDGNNLLSMLIEQPANGQQINYSYDDKLNPYKGSQFLNLPHVFEYLAVIRGLYGLIKSKEYIILNNDNNIIEVDVVGNMPYSVDQTYAFTYYDNNYPANKILIESGGVVEYVYE
jgi:hypothetical protein